MAGLFRKSALCMLVGALVLVSTGSSTWAAESSRDAPVDGMAAGLIDADVWAHAPDGLDPGGRLSLLVRLENPSALDVLDAVKRNKGMAPDTVFDTSTVDLIHRNVARQQASTVEALEALGGSVVGQLQTTINAVHVNIHRSKLPEVAGLPGVSAVVRAPYFEPQMDDARPHVGATRVAEELGIDGSGVTIAIIDTGIDYFHLAFDGSGDPEEAFFNDVEVIDDYPFPTDKVVGGWDFVGFDYNGGANGLDPAPDPDPADDLLPSAPVGHGTHVAGIAAGIETEKVPAGAAPGANLVALKVFGSSGGTSVAIEAIEWAVNHNLYLADPESDQVPGARPDTKIDVINMSLGAPWGTGVKEYEEVVDRAIEQGITVVASAGNNGNTPYVTGSPGATAKILSVASSFAPGEMKAVVHSEWEDGGPQEQNDDGIQAAGWTIQLEDTGPVTAELAWYGEACAGDDGNPSPPEQEVNEKIALIARGSCAFYDKLSNAASFGAVGALVFTQEGNGLVAMGCGVPSPCEDSPGIPGVMVSFDAGDSLRTLITGDDAKLVTTTLGEEEDPLLADTTSAFSSRGPGRRYSHIKPQIIAPGSNILSAMWQTGDQATFSSGTSMSSPLVAGIAALLWQRNNDQDLGLDAVDIAALAMNYADPVIRDVRNDTGDLAGVTRQGAGLVQAYESATRTTLVRSAEGIAELSFGNVHLTETAETHERSITVRNLGDTAKDYALDYNFAYPDSDADAGVSLAFDPETVTVDAGGSADVMVTMTVDPQNVKEWFDNLQSPLLDTPVFTDLEIDGYVHLTEVDGDGNAVENGDVVGVPFLTIPRRHACIAADSDEPFSMQSSDDDFDTAWSNECGTLGKLSVYQLAADDELESVDGDLPAELDIASIGVRHGTGMFNGTEAEGVEFAIAMVDSHRLLNGFSLNAFFRILIDRDQDGAWDVVAFNAPLNNGQMGIAVAPVDETGMNPVADTSQWPLAGSMNYDLDGTVANMAIALDILLGSGANFDSGDLSFDFAVLVDDDSEDYSYGEGVFVDMVPDDADGDGRLTFDQSINDCLSIVDTDLEPMAQPSMMIDLPADNSAIGIVQYTCEEIPDDAEPIPTGLLSVYTYNLPGMGTAWDVRRGAFGKVVPPPPAGIYLPMLTNNYDSAEDGAAMP